MGLSSSGRKRRHSDLAVPDTDTKSRRGLHTGTRFSAIRNYAGRAPELSFELRLDACGGSSSYSSRGLAYARDHSPPRWHSAGPLTLAARSPVLTSSCVSIPSKKSSVFSIINTGTKTITRIRESSMRVSPRGRRSDHGWLSCSHHPLSLCRVDSRLDFLVLSA